MHSRKAGELNRTQPDSAVGPLDQDYLAAYRSSDMHRPVSRDIERQILWQHNHVIRRHP